MEAKRFRIDDYDLGYVCERGARRGDACGAYEISKFGEIEDLMYRSGSNWCHGLVNDSEVLGVWSVGFVRVWRCAGVRAMRAKYRKSAKYEGRRVCKIEEVKFKRTPRGGLQNDDANRPMYAQNTHTL
jgi:hypothetical protein